MNAQRAWIMVISAMVLSCGMTVPAASVAQQRQTPSVRHMDITGEIAKARHGYVIRGVKPAEIFTILNAEAEALDPYVKAGTAVRITVRIVSGDNVNIETIDGKPYGAAAQEEKKQASAPN